MLVFRSEAHVTTWLDGRPRGTTIPIAKLAQLADVWWRDRLAPDWRPKEPGWGQATLDGLGLSGPFWRLG
jgi:hypothetical protein